MEKSLSQIIADLGGTLRLSILSYLWSRRKMYPSELADEIKVSRTQISRELAFLEENELIIKTQEEKFVAIMLSSKSIDLWSAFFKYLDLKSK